MKTRDHRELTAKPGLGTESERGPKGPLGAAGANGQDVPSKVVMVLLDVTEVGAQGVHFERLALLGKGMRGSAWEAPRSRKKEQGCSADILPVLSLNYRGRLIL